MPRTEEEIDEALANFRAHLDGYESGKIKPPEARHDLLTKDGEAAWRKSNIENLEHKIESLEKEKADLLDQ